MIGKNPKATQKDTEADARQLDRQRINLSPTGVVRERQRKSVKLSKSVSVFPAQLELCLSRR